VSISASTCKAWVLHVGKVGAQTLRDRPGTAQNLLEDVARRCEEARDSKQFLAESEEVGGGAFLPLENRRFNLLDPFADPVLDGEISVHEALEERVRQARDAVFGSVFVLLPAPAGLLEERENRGGTAVDRHEVVLAPVEVELARKELGAGVLRGVHDDEVVAGVGVAARSLVRTRHFVERELVEPELAPQEIHSSCPGSLMSSQKPVSAVGAQLSEALGGGFHRRLPLLAGVDDESQRSHRILP
jgi:hypothetical protein